MGRGYFTRPLPRLFGHRGAAGIAPENTMASFRRAFEDGADYFELDVHATRDGVVVVIHDPTLERTTNGAGAVRDLTFAELERFDAGFRFVHGGSYAFRGQGVRVPALEELLEEFPEVPLNIEIKQAEPPIEPAVVSLLERKGALERVVLAAEDDSDHKTHSRTRAGRGDERLVRRGSGFLRTLLRRSFRGICARGPRTADPGPLRRHRSVSPETLAAARRFGLEVHVWTVNEESEIERLLRLGVDGVMSDFPSRLVAVARGRSSANP